MNSRSEVLKDILHLSHQYGGNQDYVLLGGGNTSWKDDRVMYVKASGHALDEITADGFVAMDRSALDAIWEKTYPEGRKEREREVLEDMMAARLPGETRRPSVEALLHSFIPMQFIVHLHPALVNGMTCARDGRPSAEALFGDEMIWVESVDPGYILAKVVRDEALSHEKRAGSFPAIIFLENHGVFVSADTPKEIDMTYNRLMDTLTASVQRSPDLSPLVIDPRREEIIRRGIRNGLDRDVKVVGVANRDLLKFADNSQASQPIRSAFTPDHIVYSGHKPLWIEETVFDLSNPTEAAADLVKQYIADEQVPPKVVLVQRTGAFGIGSTVRLAESASLVFIDTVKVAVYSESFGGYSFMKDDQIKFIRTWEVEQYRAQVQEGRG